MPEESTLACRALSTGRQQWGQVGLELFLWPTEGIWASEKMPANTDLTVESKGFPEEREQDLMGFLITWLPPLCSLCSNFLLHDKWPQISWFKITCIMSWFMWVRSPGMSSDRVPPGHSHIPHEALDSLSSSLSVWQNLVSCSHMTEAPVFLLGTVLSS